MRVGLLWTEIHDDTGVRYCLCARDQFDFVVCHYEYWVCPFLSCFLSLRHPSNIFPKCCLPCLCCVRVVHETFIAAYCFPCCGMYHRYCNMSEIKSGCCAIIWSKFCWRVKIGWLCPHTLGKESNSFLAYYISCSYAALNWNELYFLGGSSICFGYFSCWPSWAVGGWGWSLWFRNVTTFPYIINMGGTSRDVVVCKTWVCSRCLL